MEGFGYGHYGNYESQAETKVNGDKVHIDHSELSEAIKHAKKIEKGVTDSLEKAKNLKTKIEDGEWSGQTRDACLCYLELIVQFHGDIESAVKDHTSAVKDLHKTMVDFLENPEINAIKRL
ncbi:WXG100 family type VII secretion target [Bacillus sp. CLL-7-23]|uniref:WXG100 family type VII secretion target n=1 Tax=Bacillus changyiensis TaxID=3004103 RepID=A0ABT4X7D2_9BACI|nr:WXG100 family type VII secretion target [Bacillus changyiensis]MDA7028105.1 WXG100 family type VII secretion target [Bacillus changyiensis]